jgi:hypothetical protein
MWRLVLVLLGELVALAGCAHGMAGSPVRYCTTTMGYARGTPEYKDCMNVQLEPYRQMDRANMRGALAVLGGVLQGYGEAATSGAGPDRVQLFACPDGRFVSSARCYRSPTGGYVGGPPRLAPDGSYVGGSGSIILCPNGIYVAGTRCYLAPDGSYVGG